jgi:hypothetical protein
LAAAADPLLLLACTRTLRLQLLGQAFWIGACCSSAEAVAAAADCCSDLERNHEETTRKTEHSRLSQRDPAQTTNKQDQVQRNYPVSAGCMPDLQAMCVCDWKRSLLLTSLTWKGLTRRCPWRDSTITLPESTCCRHTRCPATLLLASMVVNADYSRFGLKRVKTAARSTAPPSKIHAASKFFGMFGQQEADRQGWRGLSRVQAGTEPALAGSEPKTPIDAQKTARQVIF